MPFQFNDGQAIQAGLSLVPNLRDQLMQDALMRQREEAFQWEREDRAAAMRQAEEMQARQGEFQTALEDVMMNPTPQKIRQLQVRFPEFAKGYKDAFDAMDADARQTNITQIGSIFANLNSGNTARAVEILRGRIEADKAAGEDVADDEAILAELESNDPMRVNAAKATVGITLAAATGDKFPETFGKVSEGDKKTPDQLQYEYDLQLFGKAYADQAKLARDTKTLSIAPGGRIDGLGPDPALIGLEGSQQGTQPAAQGGGDPSGSGASIPATGAAIERAALSAVPGLTVTSRKRSSEKNKAVGGVANSYHLTDQARDFVPPRGMSMAQLAQSLKAAMPGFDVINEGDHVHVEPAGSQRSAGPVRVRSKQEYDRLPVGTLYIPPDGSAPRTKT